jgi:pheromone shutdown protein TraB
MRLCRKVSPKLVEVVLDERDAVLCRSLKNAKGKRVVGVVSLQHLEGIERLWDKQ